VRFRDILGLALSALWQQKTRTLLTTLGVVFGSFVLAASLSIGQGVQETLERESHRSDRLRRVDVRPKWTGNEADIPAAEVKVKGNMSKEKTERIRKVLLDQKLRFNASGPNKPLTEERLRNLAALDHVRSLVPNTYLFGWAKFNGRTETTSAGSVAPDNARMASRIVVGRFFDRPDEHAVIVNEFLLYRFGIAGDAPEEVLGKTMRLEFRIQAEGFGLGFYLTKPSGNGMTADEAIALDKVRKQLSTSLDKFDLTLAERASLQQAMREQKPRETYVLSEEYPIIGVYRLPVEAETQNRWLDDVDAGVLLPSYTAQGLFFRAPSHAARGLDQAEIFADREENVKEIMQNVRDMGLNAYGMLEFIERERLIFLLIFGAMTCVAGVALLVAALGIANTMLMSVLERTREVGIMKAVGARNGHIQMIFLFEGALIGLLGGAVGLLLGRLAAIPADAWVRSMVSRDLKVDLKESLFVFPPWLMLTVIAFAGIVTTLAAVYPARRAARVNPVTALRHE